MAKCMAYANVIKSGKRIRYDKFILIFSRDVVYSAISVLSKGALPNAHNVLANNMICIDKGSVLTCDGRQSCTVVMISSNVSNRILYRA